MKWFHRHGPWQIVAASCDMREKWISHQGRYCLVTHLAMRCHECGAVKGKEILGAFTLDQLTGEASEVEKVLQKMKCAE